MSVAPEYPMSTSADLRAVYPPIHAERYRVTLGASRVNSGLADDKIDSSEWDEKVRTVSFSKVGYLLRILRNVVGRNSRVIFTPFTDV